MKRFSARETALLLLPVLFVGGLGLWLSKRPPATFTRNQPFQLVVEKVTRETPSPREVSEGYDTQISVVLTHRGPRPAWWENQSGYSGSNRKTPLVWKRSGRKAGVVFTSDPAYDRETKRYTARYLLSLAKLGSDDELRLRDRIAPVALGLLQCAPVKFDILARKKGEKTIVPSVSHDAGMTLTGWTLDVTPPVESDGGTDRLRVVQRFRSIAPRQSALPVDGRFEVVNGRGQKIPVIYHIGSGTGTDDFSFSQEDDGNSMKRRTASYFLDLEANFPENRGALYVRGEAWTGDNWPLKINIPLRDASGKILYTRPAKPLFRVLALSKRRATASEKLNSKADLIVGVRLEKLQPGGSKIENWRWQPNFSPHLADDSGHEYWRFSNGDSSASPLGWTATNSHAIIFRYGVNLSKLPRAARKVWFKNEIGVVGGARVPVKLQLR